MDYICAIDKQGRTSVEYDRLHMGKCLNRKRFVWKKMDYTWANIQIAKKICVEKYGLHMAK